MKLSRLEWVLTSPEGTWANQSGPEWSWMKLSRLEWVLSSPEGTWVVLSGPEQTWAVLNETERTWMGLEQSWGDLSGPERSWVVLKWNWDNSEIIEKAHLGQKKPHLKLANYVKEYVVWTPNYWYLGYNSLSKSTLIHFLIVKCAVASEFGINRPKEWLKVA